MPASTLQLVGAAAVATSLAIATGWMIRSKTRRKTCKVLVASSSKLKLDAAAAALDAAQCKAVEVPSMVADQPHDLEITQHGAKNRMWGLLDAMDSIDGWDYAVSIENGIVKGMSGEEMETWFDMAVVIVRDLRTGSEGMATSAGVQISTSVVGQWLEDGMEGTIGEIIAEELGCDKQDPHAALTKGAHPRAALLEHAIRVAAAQLSLPPAEPELA